METNKICKYCELELEVVTSESLDCIVCAESVHLECLDKERVPGELNGDVFYKLTCKRCSPTREDIYHRDELSWLQVVVLTLYNLQTKNTYPSRRGYYHQQAHIASFIKDNWDVFFNKHTNKKINLVKVVEDTLSKFNNILFLYGGEVLAAPGWWKLKYSELTPSAILSLYSISCNLKTKRHSPPDVETFESVLHENIQRKSLLSVTDESPRLADEDPSSDVENSSTIEQITTETIPMEDNSFSEPSTSYKPLSDSTSASKLATRSKRKRKNPRKILSAPSKLFKSSKNGDNSLGDPSTSYKSLLDSASASKSVTIPESEQSTTVISNEDELFSEPSTSHNPPSASTSSSKSATISKDKLRSTETMSSSLKLPESCIIEDSSFSGSWTNNKPLSDSASASKPATIPKRKRKSIELKCISPLDLFIERPNMSISHSKVPSSGRTVIIPEPVQKSTDMMSSSSPESSEPCSNENNLTSGPSTSHVSYSSDSGPSSSSSKPTSAQPTYELCHFQTCMSSISKVRRIKLTGEFYVENRGELIESLYSGISFNPYIWQDVETFPPWLQMMCQIQLKGNRHISDYVVPPRAPTVYTYVQLEHILAVNSLCDHYLCPGIDLTASLRHPEFGCVVLYKRLVVAFAFIIPDVSDFEHYLSYIFTRPGWRRVGIAKRMLYFLLTKTAGKDVTLHVPIDSAAFFMFQKFGFRVERREKNFYEKYIRMKKDECTDALFCRRERSISGDI